MYVCKVVVWQWEREKLYKSASISTHVTILRGAPCASLMLTGSGYTRFTYVCTCMYVCMYIYVQ